MGRSYYYFAASLPMLGWESKPPMTVESFLEECQRLLDNSDYTLMHALLTQDDPQVGTEDPVANAWIRFNRNFRNELAWFRAGRLNKDPLPFVRGHRWPDPFLAEQIQQAARITNPWEAQKAMDKIVWRFLDELATGQYFNWEFLFVYGLKLKILQRHREYHSPAGRQALYELRTMKLAESCVLGQEAKAGLNNTTK